MRQMYNYVNINQDTTMNIETPPDNYSPDKVGDSDIKQYTNQRNQLKQ